MNAKKLSMKKNIHEYFFSSTIFHLFFIDKKIVDEIRSDQKLSLNSYNKIVSIVSFSQVKSNSNLKTSIILLTSEARIEFRNFQRNDQIKHDHVGSVL